MLISVIDLGTNTFHLLIAEAKEDGSWQQIHREKRFIKLAENGIQRIGAAPFARGMDCLQHFAEVMKQYKVQKTKALGTAGLRTAENGADFIAEAKAKTGIQIELIDGGQEAAYIHRGVSQAVPMGPERELIMDIGGGSVEFIIANAEQVFWQQSFPVGVAVLYRNFHQQDPIASEEIRQLKAFLDQQLAPLKTALMKYPSHRLIGAAGTFDVIGNLLGKVHPTPHCVKVELDGFTELFTTIIQATSAQRHAHSGIPDTRADMIVVALILVQYVLELAQIHTLHVSHYSMKEGIIAELLGPPQR